MALNVIDKNITRTMLRFGQTAKYYQSRICSCIADNNGSFLPGHNCNQGFFYAAPETVQVIRTNISTRYLNQPNGHIFTGGANFTFPKYYNDAEQKIWTNIARGDVIVLDNKTRRDTDILKKGVRDTLQAFDITEILSVHTGSTEYTAGVDFNFVENNNPNIFTGNTGSIDWISGRGPAANEHYTVEFTCKAQYRIWDDGAGDRGTDEEDLPKKVVAVVRKFVNPETNVIDNIDTQQKVW